MAGKHVAILDWERDTVSSPPDDLVAIHMRNTDTNQHGWFFRDGLWMPQEQNK